MILSEIKELYYKHIKENEKLNFLKRYDKFETWFHASSAGMCIRKHAFKYHGIEPEPITDLLTLVTFRIGELVHEDMLTAIQSGNRKGITLVEQYMEIPHLNVRGFMDLATILGNKVQVDDLKTIKSYKYSKLFGIKKNRDPDPADNYEYQIGTYSLFWKLAGFEVDQMSIIYIKKDDSRMKQVIVPLKYIKLAEDYWTNVNKIVKENEIEKITWEEYPLQIPRYEWECNYCQYKGICNPPDWKIE